MTADHVPDAPRPLPPSGRWAPSPCSLHPSSAVLLDALRIVRDAEVAIAQEGHEEP